MLAKSRRKSHYLKRVQKQIHQITDKYLYCLCYLKSLKELFLIKQEFLSLNKILYNYQSGFRKNHSTDTCLSFLNDKILKGFVDGLVTGMILINLQKAFDTINHDILLKKVNIIGFSDHTVKWFQSYLSNRKFMVNLENSFSEVSSISCYVPQGSILGPLLFLVYVNDMPMAVKCDLFFYAVDTCLVFKSKNVNDIEKELNEDFANICDWFVDNKLSIRFGEDKLSPSFSLLSVRSKSFRS